MNVRFNRAILAHCLLIAPLTLVACGSDAEPEGGGQPGDVMNDDTNGQDGRAASMEKDGGAASEAGFPTEPALGQRLNGARCTNNAPVSGSCESAGDQCTYDTETATHYCTCLRSAPTTPGEQGWSCR